MHMLTPYQNRNNIYGHTQQNPRQHFAEVWAAAKLGRLISTHPELEAVVMLTLWMRILLAMS